MPATQITIVLNSYENEALRQAAQAALRRPKDQARYLLRHSLGLSPVEEVRTPIASDTAASETEAAHANAD